MIESNKAAKKNEDLVNKAIKSREVIIINEDGSRKGPLNKFEALKSAEENGLDMVQVGQQGNNIAIVKFLDYGKYKYEQKRKQRENKKHQNKTENREIRLTVAIGEHDLETKAKKAREFLLNGDRIKVSLKFRGREIAYQEFGLKTLDRFFDKVKDIAKIEKEAKLNMRFLDMYIVPNKKTGGKKDAKDEN
ncbi:translation initiation factor IF-3 [Spiroplasma endosymbiont of Crioceris asparagi]|uniref:translation initiation factor IF-3 n=1 Tax=Spiroplasma endosymbiont of Crioceris asparagi TaxID=3066286 RepID=UPI0030CDE418